MDNGTKSNKHKFIIAIIIAIVGVTISIVAFGASLLKNYTDNKVYKQVHEATQDKQIEATTMRLTKLQVTVTATSKYIEENKVFSNHFNALLNARISLIESKLGLKNNN